VPLNRHEFDQLSPQQISDLLSSQTTDYAAVTAAGICRGLEAGYYDQYLEAILSAGHRRKLVLRSTPGFRGRDKQQ